PVVWWDPRALDLDREERVGLRQQPILEADAEGVQAAEGTVAHARWQDARSEALARGATPSLRVAAVTRLAAEGASGAPTRDGVSPSTPAPAVGAFEVALARPVR